MFNQLLNLLRAPSPDYPTYDRTPPRNYFEPSPSQSRHYDFLRESSGSKPEISTDQFQVLFNVKHFAPDEIEVKTVDNFVVIHGQHEQQADQHGFVSREFTRRYPLPEYVEPSTVTSFLTQDGILVIQFPRKPEPEPKNERIVPIVVQQPYAVEEALKRLEQMRD